MREPLGESMQETPSRLPLSAVLITLNAASQLEACLASLAFADEILIVDSGSTDDTRTIAAKHGARIIEHAWLGFGPQKQFAVEEAAHDWVLCLDADERVTPALRASIEETLVAQRSPANGQYRPMWRMARANVFMGRILRHGEGYPDWNLRLFDRRQARWSNDPVHEHVVPVATTEVANQAGNAADASEGRSDGTAAVAPVATPAGTLNGDLLHESSETLASYLAKQNRYTDLQAAQLFAAGKSAGWARIALAPLVRFIKFYLVRLGFLDGIPGLVHILIGCQNSMMKYAKLRELQRQAAS